MTNGTTDVYLWYDTATNGKGRFGYSISYNTRWYGDGRPYWHADVVTGYDALGRPTGKWQGFILFDGAGSATTWQQYNLSRTYNLAGAVTAQTLPSGRTVSYGYDAAGQLSSFSGNLGGGSAVTYATGMLYNARGQMIREQFGTTIPLYQRKHYNRRGQLFDIRLGTDGSAAYDVENPAVWKWANGTWNRGALRLYYSSTNNDYDDYTSTGPALANNNGNVWRAEHFVPNIVDAGGNITSWVMGTDSYAYDALNRVTQVVETATGGTGTGFTQQFQYDRWGNRTIDVANTTNLTSITRDSFTVEASTNRLTQKNGVTLTYDAAGNQTYDGTGYRYYDAENKISKAVQGATSYYYYDGSGRRVRRVSGGAETWQVYGFEGELVAEYNVSGTFSGSNAPAQAAPVKEYGYRGGQLLVVFDSTQTGDEQLAWLVQDHLGSTRMIVNRSGSLAGIKRRDYLPFGEEVAATVGHRAAGGSGYAVDDRPRQKFTGHERDGETGLDFFLARYYSNTQGRFTSPDVVFADQYQTDPQSWNLYSYVGNNPIKFSDPFGLWREIAPGFWQWEENDTWETLAQKLNVSAEKLKKAFPNVSLGSNTILQLGDLDAGPNSTTTDNLPTIYERRSIMFPTTDEEYKNAWLAKFGRDDGLVPDPRQTPISRFIFGPRIVHYTELADGDYKEGFFGPHKVSVGVGGMSKNAGKTVAEILKSKKGSILNAPLPPGTLSWDKIRTMTWEAVEAAAKRGETGFKTIKKLLTDSRFDK